MSDLKSALTGLQDRFGVLLQQAESITQLEELRVLFLGKKGELTTILRGMGSLPASERPAAGQLANEIRADLESRLQKWRGKLEAAQLSLALSREAIDISEPGLPSFAGSRHPLTQIVDEISDIFLGLGYSIAEGPEIEFDLNNFELLRLPPDHPSRDTQDTFYVTDQILLRTQTSPVQIRVMQEQEPPIRIICPGRVYRSDSVDATHSPIFHQIEGLVVDEGVSMGDLVGSLQTFARELFGAKTKVRLRPHHFPFTEPSCEVDISCWTCGGEAAEHCRTCRGEGWIEILGAGMVHPEVLENCGIDSKRYSGFAFGIGVERTAMGRFGIPDIRSFFENDLRFLRQF